MLLVLCCVLSLPLAAQQRMEIIALKHRLPEQVLPMLQPLLEPGATLSAMSGKLILRASPGNIEEIRRALDAIDTRARSLMISVRQGGSAQEDETRLGVDGRVVIRNEGVTVDGRALADSRSTRSSGQIVQRIQTVEDGQARIYLGKSVPLPMTQTVYGPGGVVVTRGTQYVDLGSGFEVRPQLLGEQVILTITPQNQSLGGRGTIEGSRLSSTLRGRLGEWLPLGGANQQSDTSDRGYLDARSTRSQQVSEYWIRAEALD